MIRRMFTSSGERAKRRSTSWERAVGLSVGVKRSDLRRLFAEVVERREAFLKEWERIHG